MKLRRTIIGGGLLLLGGYAMASPPTLQPLPQNCQVTGSQNTLDFGTRTRAQLTLNQWGKLSPGQQFLTISITCRYPKRMVLSVAGKTAGQLFSWGKVVNYALKYAMRIWITSL
nr:hypothetical protein [Pantoea sp. 201603H]